MGHSRQTSGSPEATLHRTPGPTNARRPVILPFRHAVDVYLSGRGYQRLAAHQGVGRSHVGSTGYSGYHGTGEDLWALYDRRGGKSVEGRPILIFHIWLVFAVDKEGQIPSAAISFAIRIRQRVLRI